MTLADARDRHLTGLSDRDRRLAYELSCGVGIAADILVVTRSHFESRLHLPASLPATVVREGRLLRCL